MVVVAQYKSTSFFKCGVFVVRPPGYMRKPCLCAAFRLVGLSDVSPGWLVDVHHHCWCVTWWVFQITEQKPSHQVVSSSSSPTNRQVNFAGSCPAIFSGPLERQYIRYVAVSALQYRVWKFITNLKSDPVLHFTDVQFKHTRAAPRLLESNL